MRHYPGICLEELRKTMKHSEQMISWPDSKQSPFEYMSKALLLEPTSLLQGLLLRLYGLIKILTAELVNTYKFTYVP
jgi:hypothetical protein